MGEWMNNEQKALVLVLSWTWHSVPVTASWLDEEVDLEAGCCCFCCVAEAVAIGLR